MVEWLIGWLEAELLEIDIQAGIYLAKWWYLECELEAKEIEQSIE